jgi:hypothetical protein
MERNPFLVSLDNDNDEAGVRARLASHHGYQESYKPLVREWLRECDEARAFDSSAKRDAREEMTLSIAKEANRLASEANAIARLEAAAASRSARYAMYAAVIAAIGAIIAAKSEMYEFILKYLPLPLR